MEFMLGEVKTQFVDGEIVDMIWNGEKWLRYADVLPLIFYAQTGRVLNLGEKKCIVPSPA